MLSWARTVGEAWSDAKREFVEGFRDLTEDGNRFREDRFKLPGPEELFSITNRGSPTGDEEDEDGVIHHFSTGGDLGFKDDAGVFGFRAPMLMVAPLRKQRSGELDRRPPKRVEAGAYGSDLSTPGSNDGGDPSSKRRRELFSRKRSSGSFSGQDQAYWDAARPVQVVLQPGAAEDQEMKLPGRIASSNLWCSLHECPAIRDHILLTEERLQELHQHLPVATRFASCWKMIYSPRVHGVSMRSFYRQCQNWPGETLLLAEDTNGVVFGGFASHTWQIACHKLHYGTPECFVFSFGPPRTRTTRTIDEDEDDDMGEDDDPAPVTIYPWAGGNQYFMYADNEGFAMGGGNGFAFWIGSDFLLGNSAPSETFGTKEPLASGRDFVVRNLECWSFDRSMPTSDLMNFRSASKLAGTRPRPFTPGEVGRKPAGTGCDERPSTPVFGESTRKSISPRLAALSPTTLPKIPRKDDSDPFQDMSPHPYSFPARSVEEYTKRSWDLNAAAREQVNKQRRRAQASDHMAFSSF